MPEFIPAGAVGVHLPYSLRQAGGGEGVRGSPRSRELPDADPHQVLADDQFPAGPGLPAVSPSAGLCMMGHPRLRRSPDGVWVQAQFRDGLFPMGSPKGAGLSRECLAEKFNSYLLSQDNGNRGLS